MCDDKDDVLSDDDGRPVIMRRKDVIMLSRYEDMDRFDREYWTMLYCYLKCDFTPECYKEYFSFMNYEGNAENDFCS